MKLLILGAAISLTITTINQVEENRLIHEDHRLMIAVNQQQLQQNQQRYQMTTDFNLRLQLREMIDQQEQLIQDAINHLKAANLQVTPIPKNYQNYG